MTLDDALVEISQLGDRLNSHIFFGHSYTGVFSATKQYRWDVQLEWQDEGTTLKVETKGASFEEALLDAWGRMRDTAFNGLGKGALTPTALPAPVDGEVPF